MLMNIEPVGDKIYTTIPISNGYHVITKPFNIQSFKLNKFFYIDINKDSPTILYYKK